MTQHSLTRQFIQKEESQRFCLIKGCNWQSCLSSANRTRTDTGVEKAGKNKKKKGDSVKRRRRLGRLAQLAMSADGDEANDVTNRQPDRQRASAFYQVPHK